MASRHAVAAIQERDQGVDAMTREEITRRLELVFQEVFEDIGLSIREDMTEEDIEDWDSVEHVYLLMSIEKLFGIEMLDAMEKPGSIGKLIDIIEERTRNK